MTDVILPDGLGQYIADLLRRTTQGENPVFVCFNPDVVSSNKECLQGLDEQVCTNLHRAVPVSFSAFNVSDPVDQPFDERVPFPEIYVLRLQ